MLLIINFHLQSNISHELLELGICSQRILEDAGDLVVEEVAGVLQQPHERFSVALCQHCHSNIKNYANRKAAVSDGVHISPGSGQL